MWSTINQYINPKQSLPHEANRTSPKNALETNSGKFKLHLWLIAL